jgi:hypothetical protein
MEQRGMPEQSPEARAIAAHVRKVVDEYRASPAYTLTADEQLILTKMENRFTALPPKVKETLIRSIIASSYAKARKEGIANATRASMAALSTK